MSDMHEHKLKLILSHFNFINTWCVVNRRTPANKCFPTPFFHENLLLATTHYKWQISGKTSLSTDIQIIFLVNIDTLLKCNDNKIYFWHGAKIGPYCTSSFLKQQISGQCLLKRIARDKDGQWDVINDFMFYVTFYIRPGESKQRWLRYGWRYGTASNLLENFWSW